MKVLLLMAALFTTAAANADLRYESVTFRASSAWVPANKTCIKDGNIYRKAGMSVTVCASEKENGQCTKYAQKALAPQPVVDTYTVCVSEKENGTCTEYGTLTSNQSVKNVYKSAGDKEVVVGKYKIPACATAGSVSAN